MTFAAREDLATGHGCPVMASDVRARQPRPLGRSLAVPRLPVDRARRHRRARTRAQSPCATDPASNTPGLLTLGAGWYLAKQGRTVATV